MIFTLANIITGIRIVLSIALLFSPAMSYEFFALYLMSGLTDMIDGPIARRTNTVSLFGSKLDTIADAIFVFVCIFKMLPVLSFEKWVYIWTGIILCIKLCSIGYSYLKRHEFPSVHSMLNRICGCMLFTLPFSIKYIDVKYTSLAICAFATIAALDELKKIFS